MSKSAAPEFKRRLLTPTKIFQIKPSKIPKSKSIEIAHDGQTCFHVSVDSMPFSSKVDVVIRKSDSKKGPGLATARLNSKENGLTLFLGDPSTVSPMKVQDDLDAGMLDRNYRFILNGQGYAWQCTGRHSIRIPTTDGQDVAEETNGQDWKLVKMSAAEPKIDDEVLAAIIRERNDSSFHGDSGAANLHWFADVDVEVEYAGMAILMGILERERRSSKEWSSGTSLLFG